MPTPINRSIRPLLLALLLLAAHAPLSGQPPAALLRQGVELGVIHDYEPALDLFGRLSTVYPGRPEGPFYRAAIHQSMMLDFESDEWQELFYADLEEAIHRALQQLRLQPEDAEARFYAGAAYAYKSAQLSRDGKYWPAYRAIQSSLDYLEPLLKEDSTWCDALLGVGTYQYWRSRITIKLSWLPFFPDRRREGIAMITRAAACAQLSPASAWSNLAWISIREKEYDRAIVWSRTGLERYPGSRFFLWPIAEAQFLKGDYSAAIGSYSNLLLSTREAPYNNGYNELVILWKMAQCHERIGENDLARSYYQEMVDCRVAEEVRGRAESKIRMAREWLAAH
ncbi:MAG TPA: hypothetical protein PKY55_06670 [bacterium]|nr:hypothetical protein [bacterium]HPG82940.1 hypothetical protein [bacterium]HPM59974.1 hypothetical protein [bacterium]